jgi:hypothetical protein
MQTDGWKDRWIDRQIDIWTESMLNRWTIGEAGEQINRQTDIHKNRNSS